jgi:hypothetical protein
MSAAQEHGGGFGAWSKNAGPMLTADEVAALPDGTEVEVVWSGGNGPHRYHIRHVRGQVCVDNIYTDPLTFVGSERFHTRVRAIEETPETGGKDG